MAGEERTEHARAREWPAETASDHEPGPRSTVAPPQGVSPRVGLAILPVLVYWFLRRVAGTQIAIAAGFGTGLIVFATNRQRGVIGALAMIGIVVTGGAALVGLALNNDTAYLANDPLGDLIMVAIALGSIALQRPLFGTIARELAPQIGPVLGPAHRVFFLATWLWALVNTVQGATRIVMLQHLTVDEYLLWSRAVSWPTNAALLIVTFALISRAARRSAAPVDRAH